MHCDAPGRAPAEPRERLARRMASAPSTPQATTTRRGAGRVLHTPERLPQGTAASRAGSYLDHRRPYVGVVLKGTWSASPSGSVIEILLC